MGISVESFWNIFENKTPKQCFDLCISCVGRGGEKEDKFLIFLTKYFQKMYENGYGYEDEPPFPMTDDNTHLG